MSSPTAAPETIQEAVSSLNTAVEVAINTLTTAIEAAEAVVAK